MISIKISRYGRCKKTASALPGNRSPPAQSPRENSSCINTTLCDDSVTERRDRCKLVERKRRRKRKFDRKGYDRGCCLSVFFSRGTCPGNEKYSLVLLVGWRVEKKKGITDPSRRGGTFSSRPLHLLSPRCSPTLSLPPVLRLSYYLCISTVIFSCGSPFHRIIKSLSADCLLLPWDAQSTSPRYTVCCCIVLARGNARRILGVLRGVRERL